MSPVKITLPATSSLTSTQFRSDCSSPEASQISDAHEESSSEADAPAFQIAELVLRECAFLRLQGYHMCAEGHPVMRKQGVTECVVFHVNGLPMSKRTKWTVPLCTTIAAVLQRVGCKAKVLHGMLIVALNEGDVAVRIDMVSMS
jgi:hypothetical protein